MKIMRRTIAIALATSMVVSASPLFAAGARRGAQPPGASLAGTATSSAGRPLANTTVQVRNLATGQLAGTTTSAANGGFTVAGLEAGNYSIEVVNAAGQIIGTSASVSVAAGATVTGVTVSASAAAIGAAAGAAAGAGAAGSGISTAVIIVTVAAAAGVAGAVAVATRGDASPSR
jgi:hypothetical protein